MPLTDLNGLTILVTRPPPLGEKLCQQIRQLQGNPINMPMMEIQPLAPPGDISTFDWLLFISPQAVYQSAAFIRKHWPIFPEKCKVAAMGMGTKEALLSEKLPVHLCPEINFSSEGLLATQEMHHVQGKKIALLQGEGGRTLLYDTLCARGAEVTRMVLYRRILPLIDPSFIREQKIDIIVTTSIDILQNFTKILPKKSWAKLYEVPLIVISQKMYDFAHDAGFHQIFIAENAGFNAIMASFTLIRMG